MKRFKQYISEKDIYGTKPANEVLSFASSLEKKYGVDLFIYLNNGNYLTLSRIIVPKDKRETGIGTEVMEKIIEFADKKKYDIYLTPSSNFGGSKERLKKWYKNFGFEKNKYYRASETMVRFHK